MSCCKPAEVIITGRVDDVHSAPGPQLQTTSLCFQSLTADSDKASCSSFSIGLGALRQTWGSSMNTNVNCQLIASTHKGLDPNRFC